MLGAAVGRVTPGDSPRSQSSLTRGEGGAGGAQLLLLPSSAFVLPGSLGLLLGFAHFPPFPGKLTAHLGLFVVVVEDGKPQGL